MVLTLHLPMPEVFKLAQVLSGSVPGMTQSSQSSWRHTTPLASVRVAAKGNYTLGSAARAQSTSLSTLNRGTTDLSIFQANPPFEWSRHRTAQSWMTRYRKKGPTFEEGIRKYRETLPIAAQNVSFARLASREDIFTL